MTGFIGRAALRPTAPVIAPGVVGQTTIDILLTTPSLEPHTGILGYLLLYRITGSLALPTLATGAMLPPNAFPFLVTGLAPGTSYDFWCIGVDHSSQQDLSAPSAVVTVTTQPAVINQLSIFATKTYNPNVPNNVLWTPPLQTQQARNFTTLAQATPSCVPGDVLMTFGASASSPSNPHPVAEQLKYLNLSGTAQNPIIVCVAPGHYLMLDMALAMGTTGLAGGNGLIGQGLIHIENSDHILIDLRDQTKSQLLDYTHHFDPTTLWAMQVGNRATWLKGAQSYYASFAGNTTTQAAIQKGQQTAFFYQHNQSVIQINANNGAINGARICGSNNFTAAFTAANCANHEYHYNDIGCHGINNGQGDAWEHQGRNCRFEHNFSHHASHQNIAFECVNAVVRYNVFSGYWGDIATGFDGDSYAGGNCSAQRRKELPFPPQPFAAGTPFGRTLFEYNVFVWSGKSAGELPQGYGMAKAEGWGHIYRHNVIAYHRDRDANGKPIGLPTWASSAESIAQSNYDSHLCDSHGKIVIAHNSLYQVNGFWVYEESELPNARQNTFGYSSGTLIVFGGKTWKAGNTGTTGSTTPSSSGTSVLDGTITWNQLAPNLLVNPSIGGQHVWINNAVGRMDDPIAGQACIVNNIGHCAVGNGIYADVSRAIRCEGNLWDYIGTAAFKTGGRSIVMFNSFTGGATIDITDTQFGFSHNVIYPVKFTDVTKVTQITLNGVQQPITAQIAGFVLSAANTQGLGDARPVATVTGNGTGLVIPVNDATPFYDTWGLPNEVPDTAQIDHVAGGSTIVQLQVGTLVSPKTTIGFAVTNQLVVQAPVTYGIGDTVWYVPKGQSAAWKNKGAAPAV